MPATTGKSIEKDGKSERNTGKIRKKNTTRNQIKKTEKQKILLFSYNWSTKKYTIFQKN